MDATIHAMKQFGFDDEAVIAKMRELLKEYGGQYGFIEIYSVLLEALLSNQDKENCKEEDQEAAHRETSNPNQFPNPNQFLNPNQFPNSNQFPNPNQFPQFYQQTPPSQPVHQGGSFQQLLNFGEFPNPPPFDVDRNRQSQDPEDDDVVPKTQPENMRTRGKKVAERRHRKKEADSQRGKGEKKKWTEREEVALSASWASTSEDPVYGRDRASPVFWERVREQFFFKMQQQDPDYHRTKDMISSKWTDLSRKVKKFNGIMRQAMQSRRSGQNDQMLHEEAMVTYRTRMGTSFPHYACWEILKNSPVCQAIPIIGGSSKRSKTSESSSPATPISLFASFDLNESDDDDDDELRVLEEDLPRPVGRDQAKAKARKGKGKTGSSSRAEEQLELMTQRFGEFNEKIDEKMRAKALKTIMKDISHLEEPYRRIAESEKQRLIAKYFSDM